MSNRTRPPQHVRKSFRLTRQEKPQAIQKTMPSVTLSIIDQQHPLPSYVCITSGPYVVARAAVDEFFANYETTLREALQAKLEAADMRR